MEHDVTPTRPFPQQPAEEFLEHVAGLRDGEIVVRRCSTCGATQWPPRPLCGTCRGTAFEPRPVHPSGTVHTWTVVRRAFHPWFADRTPYGVAVVECEPGLRMTGLFEGDLDALVCGLAVRGAVVDLGGTPGILWTSAEEQV